MSEPASRPLPGTPARMAPFWEAARQKRLAVPRCRRCGQLDFPVPETCRHCLARDFDWLTASGRGRVYSFVVMHQVYDPAFASRTPYVVAEIALAEGPRILSNVVGCEPSEIAIAMAVHVDFERLDDETWLPVFRRA